MIRAIHLFILPAIFAACGGAANREHAAAGDTLIRPAAPRYTYTLLDSATADVDGDGGAERVELAATFELDASGEPLWEDGHQWMVTVRDGRETYPLVEQFLPWGGAAFWIVAEDAAGPPAILVVTSTLASGSGGMGLQKFVFDRARGGYVRTGTVNAFGSGVQYRGPRGIGTLPSTIRERR